MVKLYQPLQIHVTRMYNELGPSRRGTFYGLYMFLFSILFRPRKVSPCSQHLVDDIPDTTWFIIEWVNLTPKKGLHDNFCLQKLRMPIGRIGIFTKKKISIVNIHIKQQYTWIVFLFSLIQNWSRYWVQSIYQRYTYTCQTCESVHHCMKDVLHFYLVGNSPRLSVHHWPVNQVLFS